MPAGSDGTGVVLVAVALLVAVLGLGCALVVLWLHRRLGLQRGQLRKALSALAHSEQQARDANELLLAKQGVEQAFAELSTYMQGIDQHALVSVTDTAGRILRVNDKFVQTSGHRREELLGQDHSLLKSGYHDASFFERMWATIQRGEIWRDVVCNRNAADELYWVDMAIVPQKDAAGQVERYIAVCVDITEQRRQEDALHYRATHDALTELPNRTLLLERMARTIARARSRQRPVAVYFVNLNRFKQLNDSLGRGAGDQVLSEMARRLQDEARGGDTVARLAGDEFVVVCEGLPRSMVEPFGARLQTALQAPVLLAGEPQVLGGSVGVALFPDHGDEPETLVKRADLAMVQSKNRSDGGVSIFSSEMQDAIDVRMQKEARLRDAIARRELVLHYQPQVDFETGALVSLEALVRWDSPDYGFLMPGKFIGLAEESGLIGAIDTYVVDAACRQMQQWHQQGHGWIRTAVNLAATKFSDPQFKTELQEAMARYGIPPGVLELEVTESLAMRDPDAALVLMHELKAIGILLSVDDFGTGYSNLGYLKRFPADRLKVDQSFVRGLLKSPQDRAIVAAVVRLAHNLNMRAIAEGVESEDEAILLYALDVDEIQGYWMARPQSADVVEKMFDQPLLLEPAMFLQREALPVVLLVEDEAITRQLLEHLLQSFGVRVASAESAEEAMEMFHQHDYAIALVDHWLPGSSGLELLREIRKRMPHTARVLMTASNDPQVLRDAINIGGVAHFLAKPVDPAVLRNVVYDACWNTAAQRRHTPAPPAG